MYRFRYYKSTCNKNFPPTSCWWLGNPNCPAAKLARWWAAEGTNGQPTVPPVRGLPQNQLDFVEKSILCLVLVKQLRNKGPMVFHSYIHYSPQFVQKNVFTSWKSDPSVRVQTLGYIFSETSMVLKSATRNGKWWSLLIKLIVSLCLWMFRCQMVIYVDKSLWQRWWIISTVPTTTWWFKGGIRC